MPAFRHPLKTCIDLFLPFKKKVSQRRFKVASRWCPFSIHSSNGLGCIVSIYMFDVILVTHKNMIIISGTHIQGLYSTQVLYHTQIDLLTCRVCFVKHVMINSQVRQYTHVDLTTCRVCSVKHMMIMRQYFPRLSYDPYPLLARGLGLCLYFSALVCDLLPRRSFDGFR